MTKGYTAYKDSGVEWIGEIPKHWEIERAKYIYKEVTERSEDGSENLLSVSEYYGISPRSEVMEEGDWLTRADSLVGYKKCKKNDLIINIMLAWKRGLGVTNWDGIVSPSYSVFRCVPCNQDSRYLHYLLRTDLYVAEFKRNSTGIIDSRLRLYPEEFLRVNILSPPLSEQKSIADYLNHKTRQIDTLIEKKQKLIELLKEQRTAIINHAVTKGLNPDVKMKDSGIDWLGEIPEHWEVKPLRYTVRVNQDSLPENMDKDYEIQYIDIGNVNEDGLLNSPEVMSFGVSPSRARRIVKKGDTIISTVRTYLKAISYIDSEDENLIVSTGFAVLTPADKIKSKYLYYLMSSQKIIDTICSLSVGVSYPAINSSELGSIPIWFPKSIEEQNEILNFIEDEVNRIKILTNKTKKEIELLKEYRTALISQVVTGKIDVRDSTILELDEEERNLVHQQGK